jgi:sarcosine oxidase, subunit alpha
MSARPTGGHRLGAGGRVKRDRPLRFSFDGAHYVGLQGDTLASALLANGVSRVSSSIRFGRPRGIFAAGAEEPNALVQLEGPCPEPMLTATTVELCDGLGARSLSGRGPLGAEPDPARYDKRYAHCDVLIVGAGPAGLAAALVAARSGARVIVADDQPQAGGSLLGEQAVLAGEPSAGWVESVESELETVADVRLLRRTTVFGAFDHGKFVALERRTDHLGPSAPPHISRQRVWHIRAARAVIATGAHERPIAFADNDRPGVMLAGAARAYVNRYAVAPGRRAVVFTVNDGAYSAAFELHDAGVEIAAIVDARPAVQSELARACRERDIESYTGHAVTGTRGHERVEQASVARLPGGGCSGATAPSAEFDCDLVLVSGGWNPAVHLYSQAQGNLRFDELVGSFVPIVDGLPREVVGSARGLVGLADCLADGADAGRRVAKALKLSPASVELPEAADLPHTKPLSLWLVEALGESDPYTSHFVDLQRDATVADVLRATRAGMRSVEHVKRYTTIGTAHDQGKTSGVLAAGVVAHALGSAVSEIVATTFRVPYTPVAFAALAGRDRGRLHDPVRTTAIHPLHVAAGALFEDVGQWKRPWYFPLDREESEAAVARECIAARNRVALMDASTLGKIDVSGPDAAEFLDRMYTNMMSTVPVGGIRYGVMCKPDGMVFDDGTAIRLADDRYLVTTTTGGAAAVLEWLEEWLQTEWPSLAVHCTSVTDHWATIALVGPGSREVLARVAPGLAVDNDSFPFMTWRDTEVAGVVARVCRISFSGELAYEINVPAWYGAHCWEQLLEAGAPAGITPYGTETMHVLRAEKGFVIVGQDTDGTVTLPDLGMDWLVSKKKDDFVGKRSLSRPDAVRPDRKQLVGLLPQEPALLLREGTQLIEDGAVAPGVRSVGHVTSSYRSAALRRTFALALIKGGHGRHGETIHAVIGDQVAPVTITAPVFYDKDGARRDG